ncbi:hypothetical protein BU15DRAFT_69535, partial [Melanogaster broomeanus]
MDPKKARNTKFMSFLSQTWAPSPVMLGHISSSPTPRRSWPQPLIAFSHETPQSARNRLDLLHDLYHEWMQLSPPAGFTGFGDGIRADNSSQPPSERAPSEGDAPDDGSGSTGAENESGDNAEVSTPSKKPSGARQHAMDIQSQSSDTEECVIDSNDEWGSPKKLPGLKRSVIGQKNAGRLPLLKMAAYAKEPSRPAPSPESWRKWRPHWEPRIGNSPQFFNTAKFSSNDWAIYEGGRPLTGTASETWTASIDYCNNLPLPVIRVKECLVLAKIMWNSQTREKSSSHTFKTRFSWTDGLSALLPCNPSRRLSIRSLPPMMGIQSFELHKLGRRQIAFLAVGWGISSHRTFMQDSLVAFIDVIRTTRNISRQQVNAEWPLERLTRLMEILKGYVSQLTWGTRRPHISQFTRDYRPDVDALTPVQASVIDVIQDVDLAGSGVLSLVMRDLSDY